MGCTIYSYIHRIPLIISRPLYKGCGQRILMAGHTYPSDSLCGPGWKQVSDAEWAALEDDDEYEDVEEEVSTRVVYELVSVGKTRHAVMLSALCDDGSRDVRLADGVDASYRVSAGGEHEPRTSFRPKKLTESALANGRD
jgi:hypothetical protein